MSPHHRTVPFRRGCPVTARALLWTSPMRHWLVTHPYTAIIFVVLVGASIPFSEGDDSEWEQVYVKAACQLRKRGHLSARRRQLVSALRHADGVPFTWLPTTPQRWLWLVINLPCIVFMLWGAWRVAGGGKLEGASRSHCGGTSPRSSACCAACSTCKTASPITRPIWSSVRRSSVAVWR